MRGAAGGRLVTLSRMRESPTRPCGRYRQAVLVTGHVVDLPDRPVPRFPPAAEPAVTAAVASVLDGWQVGSGTLVVSGGARGADIIGAEQALALGADVWLLLALPDDQFTASSVAVAGTDWEQRFRRLRSRCATWVQADDLGPAGADEDVFERNNDWCLTVAGAQAGSGVPRVVAVWDGGAGDGPGGTAHLVQRAMALGAPVQIIHPAEARAGATTPPARPSG